MPTDFGLRFQMVIDQLARESGRGNAIGAGFDRRPKRFKPFITGAT